VQKEQQEDIHPNVGMLTGLQEISIIPEKNVE
jgi:hypothetical protein